jgi:hypothetical protein
MKTNPNFKMPKRGLFEDSQYPQKMNYGNNGNLFVLTTSKFKQVLQCPLDFGFITT